MAKNYNNAYYCSVHLLVFLALDFFLPQPTVQGRLIKSEFTCLPCTAKVRLFDLEVMTGFMP